MSRRSPTAMTLVLGLAACALAAAPLRAQAPPRAPVQEPERGRDERAAKEGQPEPVLDPPAEASKRLRATEKALADREPRVRSEALEPFLTHRSELYVKRLAAVLDDKHEDVAVRAAKALANQPFPAATDALLAFACKEKNVAAKPEVVAAAILALGEVGLGKKGYDRLRALFDDGDAAIKGAVFQAFAAAGEKRSFSLFVDHFEAPQPENVNSGSNPPESYWRAKHAEWSAYRQHVHKGIKTLTGAALTNAQAWKEWAAGDGKALGFAYSKGS